MNTNSFFLFCLLLGLPCFGPVSAQSSSGTKPLHLSLPQDKFRQEIDLHGHPQRTVELCGLVPGDTYTVWASRADGCPAAISLPATGQRGVTFPFIPELSCVELVLHAPPATAACPDMPARLSIARETEDKPSPLSKMANLSVASGFSDQHLVQEVFIGGGCFDVNNVAGIGPAGSKGTFSNGGASIFIDDGVIISSGSIINAPGPNNSNSAGNNAGGGSNDPDLAILTGGNLFDVTGIEFDFQPTINTIEFDYVFASEEYCEYAPPNNSGFNDVFGFFISGPGINGGFSFNGQNISVLPNSSINVSINNVNPVTNSGYFVGNQSNCGSTWNMDDIQFDGFTTLLTAVANVIPCETYRIRLMVADVGDGIYDSAVFLRANSFSAGGTGVGEASSVTTGTNVIYENCNDGFIIFNRAGGDINMPLILDYTISPNSTATPGDDYVPLSGSVVIPPGMTSWQVPINVFNDNIPEGIETIILSITNSCSCSSLEMEIEIHDPPPLEASLPDFQVCEGVPIILEPVVDGGIPNNPYSFAWDNGSTSPVLAVVPTSSGSYTVTVTDACGTTATATSNVSVSPIPTAILSGSGLLCPSNPNTAVEVSIQFTGEGPWEFVLQLDGVPQPPVVTTDNPYVFQVSSVGTYQLESVLSVTGNCQGAVAGIAAIVMSNLEANASSTPAGCTGNGTISVFPAGGSSPYSYEWSNGAPNQQSATNLPAGTYSVTVTDSEGCSYFLEETVASIASLDISATPNGSADCLQPTGGSIDLSIIGGTQPFDFLWTNGIGNIQNPSGLPGGTYEVTVTDAAGCTASASATIPENFDLPNAVASAPFLLTCILPNVQVLGSGSEEGPAFSYQWSGPGVVGPSNEINATVNLPGSYSLTVTNTDNGCTASATTEVSANYELPLAIAIGGELSCTVSEITLDGSLSSAGPNFSYLWSGPGIVNGELSTTPTVNQAGSYTLLVTDTTNGCTHSATTEVTLDNSLPIAFIQSPVPLNCQDSVITLNGSGSSAGPNIAYEWSWNNVPLPESSNLLQTNQPGTYQLTVTNTDNGCASLASVTVVQDLSGPTVSASADGQLDCNTTSVGLAGSVDGNPANFSFAWSTADGIVLSGANSPSATAGAAGTYVLTVTDLANGCSSETAVVVSQDDGTPSVEILPAEILSCSVEEVLLDATASSQGTDFSYTWTTADGQIVSGGNSLTPLVNAPGTYSLTILDPANNCESTGTVIVTQDTAAPYFTLPADPVLTCHDTVASVAPSLSSNPGTSLSFSWSTTNGQFQGGTQDSTAYLSASGTYSLIVTNADNGCTASGFLTVTQDTLPPVASVSPPPALDCTTDTLTLDGSGSSTALTYLWSASNGGNLLGPDTLAVVQVGSPGTYTLLVSNPGNGCTAETAVTVLQDVAPPAADAGPPDTLTCTSNTVTLLGSGSASPSVTYEWNGPGIVSGASSLTPTIDLPGDYTLLVTDLSNGCTNSDTVSVGIDTLTPVAIAGPGGQLSCSVSQLTLDGSNSSNGPDIAFSWSTQNGQIGAGINTPTPTVNAPGVYTLTVTDNDNGCSASDAVTITQDDDLPTIVTASPAPLTCLVGSVPLDASGSSSGPEFLYQWSTANGNIVSGGTSPSPLVDAPGTYLLAITNTLTNCTSLASVTVSSQTTPPAAQAGPAPLLSCSQTVATLQGAGSAIGNDIAYLWSTNDGNLIAGQSSLNAQADQPGLYTLTVTNLATGCSDSDTVSVSQDVDPPLAAADPPDTLTCSSPSVSLDGSGSSNGPAFSFAWSTADGNILSGADSPTPSVNQPGSYLLTVTDTGNGCSATTQVVVTQDIQAPSATAASASPLTCLQQTLTLDGSGGANGPPVSFLWSTTSGNILSGTTTPNPLVNQPGTYVLTVTNIINGCSASDQVTVSQNVSTPQLSIAPPATLTCTVGEVAILTSTAPNGDYGFSWTSTDGNIVSGADTPNPLVDQPGTYSLLVTNPANGCTTSIQASVSQDVTAPDADAGPDFLLDCVQGNDLLDGTGSTGTGALAFAWSTATGEILPDGTSAQAAINAPGTYFLTVTNLANGCTDTDQVSVGQEAPTIRLDVLQPRCSGTRGAIDFSDSYGGDPPYVYSVDGGISFSSNALFTNLDAGLYSVVVQDARGCEDESEALVEEATELTVSLEPTTTILLGDSYQILALTNLPPEEIAQVNWFPAASLSCTDCLDPVATPLVTTLYKVTVTSLDGCQETATLLLRVDKRGGLYVPSAFSPNGDGANDRFMIFSDPESVLQVKSFLVFSRWGETVHQFFDFKPNDPTHGWDGFYRGKPMNPDVFSWFATVEFIDGRVEIITGDVTLMR
ncbi:MAG: hypothetical protein RLY31_1655 [Bacteroidota bacterium]